MCVCLSVCPKYFGGSVQSPSIVRYPYFLCFLIDWRIREGVFLIFFKFWFLGPGDGKKGNFFEKVYPFDLIFGTGTVKLLKQIDFFKKNCCLGHGKGVKWPWDQIF